jgi:hypothetical protein
LITVPFLTDGIAGCTAFFREVEIVAFAAVRVRDLTGPETFNGIAKVVVLVTSPFAFLVTPIWGAGVSDGDVLVIGEGFGEGPVVGVREGVGDAVEVGVGDAVTIGS